MSDLNPYDVKHIKISTGEEILCEIIEEVRESRPEDMKTSTASTLASLKHHSLRLLREYHVF